MKETAKQAKATLIGQDPITIDANQAWRQSDKAILNQQLDKDHSVTLNRKYLVVSGAAPVMFAPLEYEEDGAQYFVFQCHNGTLVSMTRDE